MSFYRAPQGRPICSPPSDNSNEPAPVYKREYQKVTDADRAKFAADRAMGMTFADIARKYARPPSTVKKAVHELPDITPAEHVEVHGRRWKKLPDNIRDAIRSDYEAGVRAADIAKKYSVIRSVVYRATLDLRESVGVAPRVVTKRRDGWHIKDVETWAKRAKKGVRRSYRSEERGARRACEDRNKDSVIGMWVTAKQCVDAGVCKARRSVEKKARIHGWERADWKDNSRITIYCIPHDDPWWAKLQPAAVNEPVTIETPPLPMPVIATPATLSLWERIKMRVGGWF